MGVTRRYSLVNNVALTVPAAFEGILPVSPCSLPFVFEPFTFLGLASVLKPGSSVFDVGASYGIVSTLIALTTGSEVHAFEANPAAIQEARILAAANERAWQIHFVASCVGERSGGNTGFFIVPGDSAVRSTRNPEILNFFPQAQQVETPMLSLDHYCEAHPRLAPACIKLDIEGGEHLALRGARRLLARSHPDLVIETHGNSVIGLGGSVLAMCDELVELGYHLFDLQRGALVSAQQYGSEYGTTRIGQLLASERLLDPEFAAVQASRRREMNGAMDRAAKLTGVLDKCREMVNSGKSKEAIPLLEEFLVDVPAHAEGHYLLACCLHWNDLDLTAALSHLGTRI
jgi:FkbM family methyltransferase